MSTLTYVVVYGLVFCVLTLALGGALDGLWKWRPRVMDAIADALLPTPAMDVPPGVFEPPQVPSYERQQEATSVLVVCQRGCGALRPSHVMGWDPYLGPVCKDGCQSDVTEAA